MFRRRAIDEPEVPPAPSVPPALDERARLHAMFDAHHQLVWRTLRRYGLDAEAAADVVQQAYVVAVERVADIWPGSERAFLIGTALRLARAAGRKASRLSLDDKLDEQPLQRASQPEAQAATLELLDRVLSQLEPGLIEVFVLFDVEGFSAREVAEALAIPEGTVASRVRRARAEFRAVIKRLSHVRAREEGGR
jgi:RNA polymerase sigma-70 factor (ECF subfamily)